MPVSLRRLLQLLLLSLLFLTHHTNAEEAYWEYTFRPGDTIWQLAKTYTTSVKNWLEIQKINHISQGPDRQIPPGTRIKIPVSMLKMQAAPAVVVSTSENVQLTHTDNTADTLATYNKLFSGDTITTVDGQFVTLRFADGSMLNILPNSSVTMDTLSQFKQTGMIDTRIHVESGNIDTRVNLQPNGNRYEITTPSAVTAVRGTQFRVSADAENITRTEVAGGIVAVSAGDSTQKVNKGFGVIAEKGKPVSEPIKLLEAPQLAFDNIQTLQWQALDKAVSYHYQVATDTEFSHIISDARTDTPAVSLTALQEGSYFARVRGIDTNKLEGINAQLAINIKPVPVEEEPVWPVFVPATIFLLGL